MNDQNFEIIFNGSDFDVEVIDRTIYVNFSHIDFGDCYIHEKMEDGYSRDEALEFFDDLENNPLQYNEEHERMHSELHDRCVEMAEMLGLDVE